MTYAEFLEGKIYDLTQQRAELLEALKSLVGGYEDTTATGMMDMLVIGEDVRKAVNAITKAEADK